MIRLGVNIDHVATVRQARRASEPEPVTAALLALLGGADSITVHLREDRRHIQDRDVRLLRPLVPRLNLEMACVNEIIEIACDVKPDEATLVPEKRQELTTEGGLDVVNHQAVVTDAVRRLQAQSVSVSLFIDPDPTQIVVAKAVGAHAIELCAARYSEVRSDSEREVELEKLRQATAQALGLSLKVHMGHGLNYFNVKPIVRISGVEELNIGHSIVARAVLVGLERAVREMKEAMTEQFPIPRN
jgi:pyridoxine 5-phosphate synthase